MPKRFSSLYARTYVNWIESFKSSNYYPSWKSTYNCFLFIIINLDVAFFSFMYFPSFYIRRIAIYFQSRSKSPSHSYANILKCCLFLLSRSLLIHTHIKWPTFTMLYQLIDWWTRDILGYLFLSVFFCVW